MKVVGADGVAIENLTARNYTENGFFWTGVLGYRGSYLTAYRNGDYGIYAFDSQWGQFDHSYASGSPDAGFYIGQCDPCHALITDVVAEHNQLGYSGTNSSGDLFIVRSSWAATARASCPTASTASCSHHRATRSSPATPCRDNGSADAATGNEGFDVLFGVGIAIIGAEGDVVTQQPCRAQRGDRDRHRADARHRRQLLRVVRATRCATTRSRDRGSPISASSRATPTTRTASRATRSRPRRRRTSNG